jgi:transposase
MAKKQIDKKKINIKLLSGQTYLVLDAEKMFQVSTALVHLASGIKDDKERLEILKISEEAIKAIAENKYTGDANDEDEW